MGQTMQALGQGPGFTHEGKSYTLLPLNFERQALVENALEQRAWEQVRRARRFLPEDEYQEEKAGTRRDITAGVYSFGGQVCGDFLRTLPGIKVLMKVCLRGPGGMEADDETVEAILQKQLEEVAALLEQANADPEGDGPKAGTGEGTPGPSSTPVPPSPTTPTA
jgi:hypothetical protein